MIVTRKPAAIHYQVLPVDVAKYVKLCDDRLVLMKCLQCVVCVRMIDVIREPRHHQHHRRFTDAVIAASATRARLATNVNTGLVGHRRRSSAAELASSAAGKTTPHDR